MFAITGKQEFGAVWKNGKCLAVFQKGVAVTDDPAVADILRADGFSVTGEAPALDSLDKMKVDELRDYAKEKGVDLGEAAKKADILSLIQAAEAKNDE